jgi:cell division protein FtsB
MNAPMRRAMIVFAFLAVVGYAFVTLRGPGGVPALLEKNRQADILEKSNAARAQAIERKRERIQRLKENPAEQELEIKQRLKYVGPHDKVFVLGEQK